MLEHTLSIGAYRVCPLPAVNQTADKPYYLFDGYAHLGAGLACGLSGLGAGMAIGIVGDAGVRSVLAPTIQDMLLPGPWPFSRPLFLYPRQLKLRCLSCHGPAASLSAARTLMAPR